jgi:Kef-type K+ transport system membrane component KefB
MSTAEFGSLTLLLLVVLTFAHLLGHLFIKLRQPRVVGEILAGVVLGPSILGHFFPHLAARIFTSNNSPGAGDHHAVVLGFLYNLGLLLLMFASGAETKGLFNPQDTREVAWLGAIGTGLPFVLALLLAPLLPVHRLMGAAGQITPLVLVVSIAMAVTSIPVISKILHDLRILHTRFARLILGVAVMEDVVLWAVLAVATALVKSGSIPHAEIVGHVCATLAYFTLGLLIAPGMLKRFNRARVNVLVTNAPIAYVMAVLLAYAALAALLHVSLVFAAFLAGLAVVKDERLNDAVRTISRITFAIFTPVYFSVVGYKLDFSKSFSFAMLALFLGLGCAVKLLTAGAGAKLAGFTSPDAINLAMALNARGGPGIVLAGVAFEANIINASFYTTLVLFAVLTSQIAGAWLDFVLRRGWPLLSAEQVLDAPDAPAAPEEPIAA